MQTTKTIRLPLVLLAAVTLVLSACDNHLKEGKATHMTALTPRLKTMFDKTKTVCFGRFLVDVPASAAVVWGEASVPLSAAIYPGGVEVVNAMAHKFIEDLKSEKAINQNDVPLLISVEDVVEPEGKIVVGYEDFQAINGLKINGYFRLKNDGVVLDTYSFKDEKDGDIAFIKNVVRRLRHRTDSEIPTESGNCIPYAFLPDEPGAEKERHAELVRIGFRLKEFPDTHLSIAVRPSNPHKSESNTLKWQLERLEKNLRAESPNHIRLQTRYLRRGNRNIHDWADGFEALSRSPDQNDIHGIHDFGMDFQGVPYDPLKPYADIRMQTGVANNAAGAVKPSLTDEEAIAVWDKITSTIRVRPTGAAAVKTAGTDPQPRLPLGELAATGRSCPQTGIWEASEASGTETSRRRRIKAGETMPRVTATGTPSLWQKLKGEKSLFQLATVWKLVEYEDESTLADASVQAQALAQIVPGNGAVNDARSGNAGDSPGDTVPPQEKG